MHVIHFNEIVLTHSLLKRCSFSPYSCLWWCTGDYQVWSTKKIREHVLFHLVVGSDYSSDTVDLTPNFHHNNFFSIDLNGCSTFTGCSPKMLRIVAQNPALFLKGGRKADLLPII